MPDEQARRQWTKLRALREQLGAADLAVMEAEKRRETVRDDVSRATAAFYERVNELAAELGIDPKTSPFNVDLCAFTDAKGVPIARRDAAKAPPVVDPMSDLPGPPPKGTRNAGRLTPR